ncbi:uncharacterized protein LOC120891906 [Ictidomys tridecemlineatus]
MAFSSSEDSSSSSEDTSSSSYETNMDVKASPAATKESSVKGTAQRPGKLEDMTSQVRGGAMTTTLEAKKPIKELESSREPSVSHEDFPVVIPNQDGTSKTARGKALTSRPTENAEVSSDGSGKEWPSIQVIKSSLIFVNPNGHSPPGPAATPTQAQGGNTLRKDRVSDSTTQHFSSESQDEDPIPPTQSSTSGGQTPLMKKIFEGVISRVQ